MKKLAAIGAAFAAAFTLAACDGPDTAETETTTEIESGEADMAVSDGDSMLAGEAPGYEALAPGTYEVTRAGDQVDYIEIHPGMTFSRVDADGEATGGVIFMKDGQTCFLVEGADEENCFTDGPIQPDGSLQTTSATGETSRVMPVDGSLEDHVG